MNKYRIVTRPDGLYEIEVEELGFNNIPFWRKYYTRLPWLIKDEHRFRWVAKLEIRRAVFIEGRALRKELLEQQAEAKRAEAKRVFEKKVVYSYP